MVISFLFVGRMDSAEMDTACSYEMGRSKNTFCNVENLISPRVCFALYTVGIWQCHFTNLTVLTNHTKNNSKEPKKVANHIWQSKLRCIKDQVDCERLLL